jgi:hypothetical protein
MQPLCRSLSRPWTAPRRGLKPETMRPVEARKTYCRRRRQGNGPASRPGILFRAGCPPRLAQSLESVHNGSRLIFSRRPWSDWVRAGTATVSLQACTPWGIRIRIVRFLSPVISS